MSIYTTIVAPRIVAYEQKWLYQKMIAPIPGNDVVLQSDWTATTVPSAKTVDFPLLHSLANISVMQ